MCLEGSEQGLVRYAHLNPESARRLVRCAAIAASHWAKFNQVAAMRALAATFPGLWGGTAAE